MDCLHRAPLQTLLRYICGVYQLDKFTVRKWSAGHEKLMSHLQPKPIIALHLDNTINQGPKPTHRPYVLSKGTPIHIGLEARNDTLEPEPAKTMVVMECPPETGIRTRDAFMKCIKGHHSDVASTIVSKDPENPLKWKCVSEHTVAQSGSHAWKLRITMEPLPQVTQPLQTVKQEEQNAGSPGPFWIMETDYKGLYFLRQRYKQHQDNKISFVQEIIDDLRREQLEVALSIAPFLRG